MSFSGLWQPLRTNRWFAFVVSTIVVAPFGWLVMYGLTIAVGNRLVGNEDQETALYLFGLPLFVAFSFAALSAVYQAIAAITLAKQTLRYGILLAPIVYWLLERGTVYGVLAPRHWELSISEWGALVVGFWTVSMFACGSMLVLRTPRAVAVNSTP